jgi:Fic family protein
MPIKNPLFPPLPTQKIIFKLISYRNTIESNAELQEFLRRANAEYWPWEVFKYKKPSKPSPPIDYLWHYLKLFTRQKTKTFPQLKDSQQKQFGYVLTDKLQEWLHILDCTLASSILAQKPFALDSKLKQEQEEWKAKSIINSLIEEATTSAQIEGAATSRRRAAELIKSGKKPRNKDERMILNNYQTMKKIKAEFVQRPLSLELIQEIQTSLTKDTLVNEADVGSFRRDLNTNDIVRVYYGAEATVLFTPPPAAEIQERLTQLCAFVNNDKDFVHPLLKGIILHFYIAYVHPFYDGNGRTARGLFYWYALKNGLGLFEFISISEYIRKRTPGYLRAFLYTEKDENDLTYFIMYNLNIILLAIKDIKKYINQKMTSYFLLKEKLKHIPGLNIRQLDLLNHALKHPEQRYTIRSHLTSNNLSWATARRDLQRLAQAGFLKAHLLGKELYFFVPVDLTQRIESVE